MNFNNTNFNMTQILIRSILKKALREIPEYPERNTRNLIDMALNFAEGRFQKNFFESARKMLHNNKSAYYKLIQDLVCHVDHNRLLTFGMNIGYMSCTYGAQKIRRIEQEQLFNIPWSITIDTDSQKTPALLHTYEKRIAEGMNLGIYTWLFFSESQTLQLLPLIKKNPDCAFVLFCPASEITTEFLSGVDELPNLMLSVRYDASATDACTLLRNRNLLYSVYVPYQETHSERITNGSLLLETEKLHPAFTFFVPSVPHSPKFWRTIYNYVLNARSSQTYRTVPIDLFGDNYSIDTVVSDDACTAFFNHDGSLWNAACEAGLSYCNLFENDLSSIFKYAFPKHSLNASSESSSHVMIS